MITLGVFIGGHDRGITLLKNEQVLAIIPEERISKIKHDSSFPLFCLNEVPKFTKEIDHLVVVGKFTDVEQTTAAHIISNHLFKLKVLTKNTHLDTDHHIYHASSGFYSSGFDEAAILTIDGFGGGGILPGTQDIVGVDTTNIFTAKFPSTFTKIYSNWYYSPEILDPFKEEDIPHDMDIIPNFDIGMIYDSICYHFGWQHWDAGKLMGLAPYGKVNPQIPSFLWENTLYGNMNLFKGDEFLNLILNPKLKESKNNPNSNQAKDLAYSAQEALEKVFIKRIEQVIKLTKQKNIVLSGGCAMNVVGNYKLKKNFPNINFYIDPLATDTGQSYGAAKHFYYNLTNSNKKSSLKNLYSGPSYSKKTLLNSIQNYV